MQFPVSEESLQNQPHENILYYDWDVRYEYLKFAIWWSDSVNWFASCGRISKLRRLTWWPFDFSWAGSIMLALCWLPTCDDCKVTCETAEQISELEWLSWLVSFAHTHTHTHTHPKVNRRCNKCLASWDFHWLIKLLKWKNQTTLNTFLIVTATLIDPFCHGFYSVVYCFYAVVWCSVVGVFFFFFALLFARGREEGRGLSP